jgi:acetyl esterase/lipase
MNETSKQLASVISRRSALASLSAGALGLALVHSRLSVSAQDATPAASWSSELNVVYGEIDGERLILDAYFPAPRDVLRPAVLLFHPGGFGVGDRTWMSDAAQGLAEVGYAAFSVDYRLVGGDVNTWPAQLDDAQRAVRWVRSNAAKYNVDPDRIASYGHSAGGVLAAFLGTRDTRDNSDASLANFSSRTAAVVDLAGSVDAKLSIADPELAEEVYTMIGGTDEVPPNEASLLDFSPIAFVDETSAPFLILQGGLDAPTRIQESQGMQAALLDAGVQVVYAQYPDYDHFVWDWAHSGPMTLAFLGEILRPEE